MMSVTLFADASMCHQSRAAGWGAWAKTDGASSMTWSGILRLEICNVSEAELFALANALHCVRAAGWLNQPRTLVMLQSDSARALQVVMQSLDAKESKHRDGVSVACGRVTLSPAENRAIETVRTIVEATGATLIVRHVKGHKSGGGRNWVNRICDELAKKQMRAARAARGSQERAA